MTIDRDEPDEPTFFQACDEVDSLRFSLMRVANGERSPYCADLPPLTMSPAEIRCMAYRVRPVSEQLELWRAAE